jgi:hypothetical protein
LLKYGDKFPQVGILGLTLNEEMKMVGHKTICPDVEAFLFGCFLQGPDCFADEITIGKMTCLFVAAQSNEIAVAAFVREVLEPRPFRLFVGLTFHSLVLHFMNTCTCYGLVTNVAPTF